MLSIAVIKQAIIDANKSMFPRVDSEKDHSFLFTSDDSSISLKQHPGFLKIWYGSIYIDAIEPVLLDTNETDSYTYGVIVQAYKKKDKHAAKRDRIFNFCSKLFVQRKNNPSEENGEKTKNNSRVGKTVSDLKENIKQVIEDHCMHFNETADSFYVSFARKILENIEENLGDNNDDKRMSMFHLEEMSDKGENAYLKLAAFTIIALIPNDANKEQMKIVSRFARAFYKQISEYLSDEDDVAGTCLEMISKESDSDCHSFVMDKELLWKAGKTWYDQTREKGFRFEGYNPDDNILPMVNMNADWRYIYVRESELERDSYSLKEKIEQTQTHIYLIGEGGIGKTTALYSIMGDCYYNKTYSENKQIPIFVELSKAQRQDDFINPVTGKGRSRFVCQSVLQQVLLVDDVMNQEQGFTEIQLEELFTKNNESPEFLLLLDGLNEVSRDEINGEAIVTLVIKEIMHIMSKYKNVKVILTSRSKETISNEVTHLYLSGIKDDMIDPFLLEAGISPKRLRAAKENESLRHILRIPLFLTLYSKLKGDDVLLSRGEILHVFYTQRRDALYTSIGRLEQIKIDHEKSLGEPIGDFPEMHVFVQCFILPLIAWTMVNESEFQISVTDIQRADGTVYTGIETLVKYALTSLGKDSSGQYCFSEYFPETNVTEKSTLKLSQRIQSEWGGSSSEDEKWNVITRNVCDSMVYKLGIMQVDFINGVNVYRFYHHHIRDYFASLHIINSMKRAVLPLSDLGHMTSCLMLLKSPQPLMILQFVGEALGELHNAPFYDLNENQWKKSEPDSEDNPCDRNLIIRTIDLYRNRFDLRDDYSVWNLFQMLKLSRKDLSGVDFEHLDLTLCCANGYKLGNKNFSAKVNDSKLRDEFFMPQGHTDTINSVCYSENGEMIVTASDDRSAIVWNPKTFQAVGALHHATSVKKAYFVNHDRGIITITEDGVSTLWDVGDFSEVLFTEQYRVIKFVTDLSWMITISESGECAVRNARFDDTSLIQVLNRSARTVFSSFRENKLLIAVTTDQAIYVWLYERYSSFRELFVIRNTDIGGCPTRIDFDIERNRFMIVSDKGSITVWSWLNNKATQIKQLEGKCDGLKNAEYSNDRKKIVAYSASCLRIWDAESLSDVGRKDISSEECDEIVFVDICPRRKHLLVIKQSETVEILDMKGNTISRAACDGINLGKWSDDGNYIVLTSDECSLPIWDANTLSEIGVLKGFQDAGDYVPILYSRDGESLLSVSADCVGRVWNSENYSLVDEIDEDTALDLTFLVRSGIPNPEWILEIQDKTEKWFCSEQISHDKERIVIPDGSGFSIVSADNPDREPLKISLDGNIVSSCKFGFDDTFVLAISDTCLYIWDTNGKIIRLEEEGDEEDIIQWVQQSNDRRFIAIVYYNHFSLWELKDDGFVKMFSDYGQEGMISIAFSSDNRYIVTAAEDGNACVYEIHVDGAVREIDCLKEHTDWIVSGSFRPGKRAVATSSVDRDIKIWEWKLDRYKCIHTIHTILGLRVLGVNCQRLHAESRLSEQVRVYLKEHGAII